MKKITQQICFVAVMSSVAFCVYGMEEIRSVEEESEYSEIGEELRFRDEMQRIRLQADDLHYSLFGRFLKMRENLRQKRFDAVNFQETMREIKKTRAQMQTTKIDRAVVNIMLLFIQYADQLRETNRLEVCDEALALAQAIETNVSVPLWQRLCFEGQGYVAATLEAARNMRDQREALPLWRLLFARNIGFDEAYKTIARIKKEMTHQSSVGAIPLGLGFYFDPLEKLMLMIIEAKGLL